MVSDSPFQQKISAARELLSSTKRYLQIVDDQIATLQDGRSGVELSDDVSTEHRVAWFGAVDDTDLGDGIVLGPNNQQASHGFGNPKTGTIRVQEDAAFVCTDILLAIAFGQNVTIEGNTVFQYLQFSEDVVNSDKTLEINPFLRLTDANTGRNLINGMSEGPLDRGRGIVPFSYLSSFRPGLGPNIKNRLFSEFTIPRAGTVKAEVFDIGSLGTSALIGRVCVTLFGFKVYGA